jgi:branched-chain amino acid transport system ATP-binding protein
MTAPASAPSSSSLLVLEGVTMRFGGLFAVRELDMKVPAGTVFGLIGPNGAGKTTIFNVVTGVYSPTGGRVVFEGKQIQGWAPPRVTAAGIARTFQNIRLFADLTVLENVMVAFHQGSSETLWDAIVRGARFAAEEERIRREARELLAIFHLDSLAEELARNLPYGSQRRLEIARAMATRPRLLCLDEPAAGMNTQESFELMKLIGWVRERFDMTILLVEHNMKVVMGVCEAIQVVDYGETIAIGPPEEIRRNPKVVEAYLGGA